MDSITVSFVKEKYNDSIETLNLSSDTPIEIAIVDAKVALTNKIELDADVYGEERLQIWWRELAYYYLFEALEKESMVRDKWDKILGEGGQIDQFLNSRINTSPSDYIITASEAILSESDILEWE